MNKIEFIATMSKEEFDKQDKETKVDILRSELVRCQYCKWHFNGHLCKQLSQYGSIETPQDFYCGFGERI